MNHLDLFSGIGGFALALKLAGIPIEKTYYSDIEPYANQIYAKNFPEAIALGDIRSINGHDLRSSNSGQWIVTGGFPCQDISNAGHRKGITGERSGLYAEMLRVIDELKPEYVLAENVAALRRRGLITVLRGFDSIGYDVEWQTLSAKEVGAVHERKRIWIAARTRTGNANSVSGSATDKHTSQRRNLGNQPERHGATDWLMSWPEWQGIKAERSLLGEPLVSRKDDGVSHRLDRIKGLGNAIVPQCAARILADFVNL